jgi:quinol monooxygenase YgiN
MTNYIRATAEISIPPEKINEFKVLSAKIIAKVQANEPDTFSYEYFLSSDESKCYVVQSYKNSEAVLAHLENISDLAGPLHEVAPLTGLMIFGSPSDELRRVLEPVRPQIFERWNGVTR